MTCDGSPIAIFGCACKIPSKTHSRPKPIRSTWRHVGSATVAAAWAGRPRLPVGLGCLRLPGPDGDPDQSEQPKDQQRDDPLMQER